MRQAFVASPGSAALRALNYSPRVERIRAASKKRSLPLREMLAAMGPAYGTVFTRIDCSADHGIELLSQTDMFAAEPQGRVIRRDSMAKPERHEVKRGQVLIAGAGTLGETELYGRALIADGRLEGKFVGPDSMTLVFEEPESDRALFAYAFLASPTGVAAVRSTSYGTKILRFRDDLLGSLPVPTVSEETMSRVAVLIRSAMAARETYMRELRAARAIVENLPEMLLAHAMCAERKARATLWAGALRTLSAWNVASVGSALADLQRSWPGRLGDVVTDDGVFYGPRFARVSCERPHGVDFMSQRDLFLIRPVPRRIVHPGFANEKLYAPRDALLVGAQGTLGEGEIFGRAVLVRGQLERMAYTQHLLRLIPRVGAGPMLYTFLSTLVGMRLLRATGVGTKLLSMREDLLREVPIPSLGSAKEAIVSQHVDAAYGARANSDSAESEAIRIIEEEVMPAWLD